MGLCLGSPFWREIYEFRGILILESPRRFYAHINEGTHKPHSILLLIIISPFGGRGTGQGVDEESVY